MISYQSLLLSTIILSDTQKIGKFSPLLQCSITFHISAACMYFYEVILIQCSKVIWYGLSTHDIQNFVYLRHLDDNQMLCNFSLQ